MGIKKKPRRSRSGTEVSLATLLQDLKSTAVAVRRQLTIRSRKGPSSRPDSVSILILRS
jgi:hypothetical protein